MAIAITLLVLEIRVPQVQPGQSLARALAHLWPSYVAYATSFLTIGIIWVNHHRMFKLIDRTNHTFLMINIAFLLVVSFIPFPTALVATYVRQRHEVRTAAFDFVDYVAILKEWADRKPRHDEVRRVLTLVGLEAVMHKRIGQLSGGMRRRVGIAQALIGRPELLVLDEPTAGLDPEQRLRFRELLGTEAAGATVLLSTHQTDDVAALCQHVVVLLAGQIRFTGTPVGLAALAEGRVWLAGERDPRAELAWITSEGRVRHIGRPPPGAQLVEPTVEDGYLVLAGRDAHAEGDALAS
jgi:energy-coupling factor transporter ATP-binding protein EcfA2